MVMPLFLLPTSMEKKKAGVINSIREKNQQKKDFILQEKKKGLTGHGGQVANKSLSIILQMMNIMEKPKNGTAMGRCIDAFITPMDMKMDASKCGGKTEE